MRNIHRRFYIYPYRSFTVSTIFQQQAMYVDKVTFNNNKIHSQSISSTRIIGIEANSSNISTSNMPTSKCIAEYIFFLYIFICVRVCGWVIINIGDNTI